MRKIMKKIVLLFALFGFAFQTTSCKSKKAQDDTQIVENADVEKIEAEDAALLSTEDTDTNVGPVDDSLQAALGETSNQAATDPALTTTDAAVTETTTSAPEVAAAPTLDENSLNNVPAPETAMNSAVTEMPVASEVSTAQVTTDTTISETPLIDPIATSSVTASDAATIETTEAVSTKPASASSILRKIAETTPYQHGEGWVNTVYIARPKEKLAGISQKIYGMDKTKELKKINSFLAGGKSVKGGDKIYYISPNRPSDSMKTLSFYEDTGMVAETYVAKNGDNLKKISKNLLGYADAYKEVWTTNSIASNAKASEVVLNEGETLRYWAANSSITPTTTIASNSLPTGGAQVIESTSQLPSQPLAQNAAPPQEPQAELPPPPMPEANQMPTPPAADQALAQNTNPPQQTELPPPPPPTDMAPVDAAALTPPPSEEIATAPEAPGKKVVTPNMEEEQATEGMNSDATMMLGGVVVLCALLAFALIRRNKKKKEVEMASMSETNVGT